MFKPFEKELELRSNQMQVFKGEQEKGLAWLEIPGLTKKTTKYTIWHVPTGLHLGAECSSKTAAVRLIKALQPLTDWETLQKNGITQELYNRSKEIRERLAK